MCRGGVPASRRHWLYSLAGTSANRIDTGSSTFLKTAWFTGVFASRFSRPLAPRRSRRPSTRPNRTTRASRSEGAHPRGPYSKQNRLFVGSTEAGTFVGASLFAASRMRSVHSPMRGARFDTPFGRGRLPLGATAPTARAGSAGAPVASPSDSPVGQASPIPSTADGAPYPAFPA